MPLPGRPQLHNRDDRERPFLLLEKNLARNIFDLRLHRCLATSWILIGVSRSLGIAILLALYSTRTDYLAALSLDPRVISRGKLAAAAIVIACAVARLPSAVGAEQVCLDNMYVPSSSPGTVFVSDSAISYTYSNCPTSRSKLGRTVRLSAGQSLYFWFRVQGDQAYLATSQSRYPFILNVYRDNSSNFIDQGPINMGALDRSAMTAEAQQTGGPFDWRLGAKKWKFDIPGTYKVFLTQQDQQIACASSSLFSQCNLIVEVVE
jgi:hypothetical protein